MAKKLGRQSAETDPSANTDNSVMDRCQRRFIEVEDTAGGVLIINSKTGKAYRDTYEEFLRRQRQKGRGQG